MGTATFFANDDFATYVDVLHWPSRGLPGVLLFKFGLALLEGVAQASASARVTLTLTGECAVSMPVGPCPAAVIRSLRPSCTSNCCVVRYGRDLHLHG